MAPAYKSVIAKAVDKVQDEGGFDNMTPKEKVNAIFKNIEPEQGVSSDYHFAIFRRSVADTTTVDQIRGSNIRRRSHST